MKFQNKTSEIHILTVSKLESIITKEEREKIDQEFQKNDEEVKVNKKEQEKLEKLRNKSIEKAEERTEAISDAKDDMKKKEINMAQDKKTTKKISNQEAEKIAVENIISSQ